MSELENVLQLLLKNVSIAFLHTKGHTKANTQYIVFSFTLEPACLNKAVCSLSFRFHFDILGLCQDIEKFG